MYLHKIILRPIDINFVNDFFEIIKDDYFEKYYDFLINGDLLRNWLQIKNKRIFYDTIKKSYKINIDYKLEKVKKSEGSGGHNREVIILTPEATKKICLMTKSKVGNNIRQYFIDLELVLYKFKNHIIGNLNKKIEQLENNK